ncbi:MAG: Holliday junction branch migration protein RuvA [Candidatus Omnitrophota bacterium]
MISRISGQIVAKTEGALIIRAGDLCYEVMVPRAVMNALVKGGVRDPGTGSVEDTAAGGDMMPGQVELVTYHYYQMEQSRAIPVLIGFQNEVEKEFFEKFISVSGVGPKAACKALAEPFSTIAGAIDSGDFASLKRLPGIGEQKARLIVAKLQGKVGKYGLIRDEAVGRPEEREDIKEEALGILLQLQYKKSEAENMIRKAISRAPGIWSSEELLNEVYRERKG